MIRYPKKSLWIATLALAASVAARAQTSPMDAEAERARRAQAELKHQAWQAQQPILEPPPTLAPPPAPAQPQAMRFRAWLVAKGDITDQTPALFEQVLAADPAVHEVHFDSPGGSLKAGLELGRIIRRHNLNTYVDAGSKCASACVWAFAGGVERTAAGVLAVHQFSPNGKDMGEGDAQEVVAMVGDYLDEMGVSRKVLDMASLVKPDEVQAVPLEHAREWRLDTGQRVGVRITQPQKRGWTQFTTMQKDGSPWFVNWDTIQTDSFGHVTIWVKHVIKNGDYVLWHIEFDGSGHQRDLSYVRYDRVGDTVSSDWQPKEWRDVIPDTVGQDLYRTIMTELAS